jgi:hypothetical protein
MDEALPEPGFWLAVDVQANPDCFPPGFSGNRQSTPVLNDRAQPDATLRLSERAP